MTLAAQLAEGRVLHLNARVTHARRGAVKHAFVYGVDHVLLAPETAKGPHLFSRNGFNLAAVNDRDHGGPRGAGQGASWARKVLSDAGIVLRPGDTLALLTQPRALGFWFAPVSFWLVLRGDALIAAIAEVSNTFGQRHSYLCRMAGGAPIGPRDEPTAEKVFYVSPFQDIAGHYRFRFDLSGGRVAIAIRQIDGAEGLVATMSGNLAPLTTRALVAAAFRRPGGALRTLGLIYWHALQLKLKGIHYRVRPAPPDHEVS